MRIILSLLSLLAFFSVLFFFSPRRPSRPNTSEMEIVTTIFEWTLALSREGFMTSTMYFKELHKSSYYIKQIVRPHYVPIITNYGDIDQFSLARKNFVAPYAVWLVLFIDVGRGNDYCRSPPGNVFHLMFNTEMLVRCGNENILREWYSIYKNRTEINDFATWSKETGIVKMVSDSLYDRRYNLQGLIMRTVMVKVRSI